MPFKTIILLAIIILGACDSSLNRESSDVLSGKKFPKVDISKLENNYRLWWKYHSKNVNLVAEFIPVDENGKQIAKKPFLQKLITGNYIPIPLKLEDNEVVLKLQTLSSSAGNDISTTIKSESIVVLGNLEKEGLVFPNFKASSIDGNLYNNQNIRGKKVLFKTWFIGCTACVKEFPELNDLVKKSQNKEMVFLALTLDSEEKLKPFLEKRPFSYKVIADQEDLIEKVGVYLYPTHIVVDEYGVIEIVLNDVDDLIAYLEI